MPLAEFSPETKTRMQDLFIKDLKPEQKAVQDKIFQNVGNTPIDLLGNCTDDRLLESIRIVGKAPKTDVIIAAIYLRVPLLSEYQIYVTPVA